MARMATKAELLALAEANFEPISPDDICIASLKIWKIQRRLKQEVPEAVWAALGGLSKKAGVVLPAPCFPVSSLSAIVSHV